MNLYSQLLESTLLPAYDRVRSRKYVERRRFLEKSQWWRPEQVRDFQWSELKSLLAPAFESVTYYREKSRAAGATIGDIRTWADYRRLPHLTREEIRDHRDALCSTAYPGKLLPHATG